MFEVLIECGCNPDLCMGVSLGVQGSVLSSMLDPPPPLKHLRTYFDLSSGIQVN